MVGSFRGLEGEYEVVEEIGAGGCGTVLCAVRRRDHLRVAIKVVNNRRLNAEARRSLDAEVQVLGSVSSKRIVRTIEVLEDEKFTYIVMEYLPGGDLYHKLRKQRHGFGEFEALRTVESVLEALVYLHGCGIAHRDLKLENIMLIDDSDTAQVKIVDFGIAHMKDEPEDEGDLCTEFCGTPQYAAPEIATKSPYIPEQVDMWCLGVVLYELIAKKSPFRSMRLSKMYEAILHEEVHFDGAAWENVSERTRTLIRALLSKNLMLRPSAQDCLTQVREILRQTDEVPAASPERSNSGKFRHERSNSGKFASLVSDLKEAVSCYWQLCPPV